MKALVMVGKPTDFPFAEIKKAMAEHNAKDWRFYPKFTCEHCGERVGLVEPNVLPAVATCPACGKRHDLLKSGGNYRLERNNVSLGDVDVMLDNCRSEKYRS